MSSLLLQEAAGLRERLRRDSLPSFRHIRTPTGTWGLKDLNLYKLKDELEPIITYNKVDGISVVDLRTTITDKTAKIATADLMTLVARDRDSLAAEHFTRITGGLLIIVEKSLHEPLVIMHHYTPGTAAFRNTLIRVASGAEAIIIELHEGDPTAASHVTEAFLAEGSRLVHATLHEAGTLFLSRRCAATGRNASMDWFELAVTNGESFSRTETLLEGEGASTRNLAVFLSRRGLVDLGATAEHRAPRTTSGLVARGALGGDAKAVYEGTLAIKRQAAKSSAFQQEHVLLLSDDAESRASPTLLIENNDVRCTHAATTGKLDAEKLFYLMCRGLSRNEAERLLVKTFVWPVIETLDNEASCKIIPYAEPIIERFVRGGAA